MAISPLRSIAERGPLVHMDLIRVKVPGGADVIEKALYLPRARAFEVTREVDGVQARHEVHIDGADERWSADVGHWHDPSGKGRGATAKNAVREAAIDFERRNPERGRIDVDGLLDTLEQAGVWSTEATDDTETVDNGEPDTSGSTWQRAHDTLADLGIHSRVQAAAWITDRRRVQPGDTPEETEAREGLALIVTALTEIVYDAN